MKKQNLIVNYIYFILGTPLTNLFNTFQCEWATLKKPHPAEYEPVYAMVIADTHLLGKRNGNWLDKWRREWQMHRAFQTAITLHKPEVVFVLGKNILMYV